MPFVVLLTEPAWKNNANKKNFVTTRLEERERKRKWWEENERIHQHDCERAQVGIYLLLSRLSTSLLCVCSFVDSCKSDFVLKPIAYVTLTYEYMKAIELKHFVGIVWFKPYVSYSCPCATYIQAHFHTFVSIYTETVRYFVFARFQFIRYCCGFFFFFILLLFQRKRLYSNYGCMVLNIPMIYTYVFMVQLVRLAHFQTIVSFLFLSQWEFLHSSFQQMLFILRYLGLPWIWTEFLFEFFSLLHDHYSIQHSKPKKNDELLQHRIW